MTKGLSSAFALAYQPLILLIDLDPTSTVDPDRDSSSQNLRPQSPRDDAETYGDIAFRNVFDPRETVENRIFTIMPLRPERRTDAAVTDHDGGRSVAYNFGQARIEFDFEIHMGVDVE